jgi:hypothetical protein
LRPCSVPRRTPKVSFDAIRSGVDQKIKAVEVAELAEIAKIVGVTVEITVAVSLPDGNISVQLNKFGIAETTSGQVANV